MGGSIIRRIRMHKQAKHEIVFLKEELAKADSDHDRMALEAMIKIRKRYTFW